MKKLLILSYILFANGYISQELNFSTYVNLSFDHLENNINLSENSKIVLVKYITKTIDSSELILGAPKIWNSSARCNTCIITPDYKSIVFDKNQERLLYKDDTLTFSNEIGKKDENNEYIYNNETGDLLVDLIWEKDNLANIIQSINTLEYWTYKNSKLKKSNIITNLKYKSPYEIGSSYLIKNLFSYKNIDKPEVKDTCFQKKFIYNIYFNKSNFDIHHSQNYRDLTQAILIDIESNKLNVHSTYDNSEISPETFFNELTIDKLTPQLEDLLYYEISEQIYDVKKSYLKLDDIIGISFEEDWYFDNNQFNIIKEVKSVTFILNKYDKLKGNKIESLMPFKIKFNH